MRIDYPTPEQLPGLRQLWREAFGDSDAFLDSFFTAAFSPRRCRCLQAAGAPAAALYWFDVFCGGKKMAYLYAVATAPQWRGRGLCRELMGDTHGLLAELGYSAAILVPEGAALARMYRTMGYGYATRLREFSCAPGTETVPLREITTEEYAALRRTLLPAGGVIQEGENLAFLAAQAKCYAGENFLAVTVWDGQALFCPELLGDASAAPGLLTRLGACCGTFRTPGEGKPFALVRPLAEDSPIPDYFGLAFD